MGSNLTITSLATTNVTVTNDVVTISLNGLGPQGANGVGVPTGGTAGQVLAKIDSTDYNTHWINGGGGNGSSNTYNVNQTNHGFSVGQALIINGSAYYTLAKADIVTTSDVLGVVNAVVDANNFSITESGLISGLSGLTAGLFYFLSDSVAGQLTATPPTNTLSIRKPVMVATSATTAIVQILLGTQVGTAAPVWGTITGTLSNQTDLQTALNAKANTSSLATVATSGAYNDLSGKPTLGTLAALNAAPAGTLTGTSLASNVVTSSLTSLGTISTGVWQATAIADNYISSAATWNAKQSAITLTTTGTSGQATFSGNILNIPQYSSGGGGITALTGDVTASGTGSVAATLATVNSNVGTFQGITINAKGLVTAASNQNYGSVTSVSVTSANGFAGTVANASTAPAITMTTSITGIIKGNGTAISAATANTDYQSPITLTTTGTSGAATFSSNTLNIPQYIGGSSGVSSISGDGSLFTNAASIGAVTLTLGTQTQKTFLAAPNATNGAPSFRTILASDVPTLNQNTTGSAATWTTSRNLAGNSVNGSADVAFANKFIAQGTADTGLSGAQFLGSLGTGIVKNTTTTGVLSIAVAGTDYQSPITLTTTGTSGAATFSSNTLNIPQYSGGSSYTFSTGLTNTSGTITVNTSQNINTLSNLTSNGLIKTSGGTGALSIAASGTDYAPATSGSSILKASGGGFANAVAGTDYQAPITLTTTGTSGAATFSSNTLNIPNYATGGSPAFSAITGGTNTSAAMVVGTGASLAVSGSGTIAATTAATLATGRTINGTTFDGSANITVTADASTLTNTTLNSTVVTSSLTSVGTLTGLAIAGTESITSSSATALTVGSNGATNPVLAVDASTASQVGGIAIKGAVVAGVTTITATSSGANQGLTLNSKGSGLLTLNGSSSLILQAGGNTKATISSAQNAYSQGNRGAATSPFHLFTIGTGAAMTLSTEAIIFQINMGTSQGHATGNITNQRDCLIQPATHTFVGASTITYAATLEVAGATIAGTNATLTTSSTIGSQGNNVGSGVVDSYGLNVSANTGATRNWAARFPGQIVYASTTPSIAAGTGAGTSPTISIAGTVEGGVITLTTGTTPTGTNATIATITNGNPFPNGSSVTLTPANSTTAALSGTSVVYTSGSTGSWTLVSGTVGLVGATAYKWNYTVVGY